MNGTRRGVRHELESHTTRLESLGIPHRIKNLALESSITINVSKFQKTYGYFNSACLTPNTCWHVCHTRGHTYGKE